MSSVVLVASPSPSVFGAPVTLTATVTPASVTGLVTFYYGTTVIGTTAITGGHASLTTRLLPSGTCALNGYYSGDNNYSPSDSGLVSQVVTPVSSALQGPVNYNTGTTPSFVVVGDFNLDGKIDIAVANQGSNSVSVLLGNGDGTFGAAQSFTVGSQPTAIAVADFNGDGKPDLAVANMGDDSVSILIGRGDGTFLPPQRVTAIHSPVSLVAADFNGDGKVDLAVAKAGSNKVGIRLGNGDGTFQAETDYPADNQPSSIAAGDFNGDGHVDLAVTNKLSNDVSILLGEGNGTFQAAVNYPVGPAGLSYAPAFVIAGDFSGDGKSDLAVADSQWGSNSVSVLLGNGDGTFQTATRFAGGTVPSAIVAADVNGDGYVDLATVDLGLANYLQDGVNVLFGTGDGAFYNLSALEQNPPYPAGRAPISAAAADFNGDGRVDLVVVNSADNTVSVLLGGSPPALSCSPTQLTFTVSSASQDSIVEACSFTSSPSGLWLYYSVPASSGTWFSTTLSPYETPSTLTASATSISRLSPGSYTGAIDVWDTGSGARVRVPVTMSLPQSFCQYLLAPSTGFLPLTGGSNYFLVAPVSNRNCSWTPTSDSPWLTVSPTTPTNGENYVQYVAAADSGGQRTATVTVGTQTFTLTETSTVLQPVSVSPSSGSGPVQNFTLQFTDSAGPTGATAQVWFTAAFGTDKSANCLISYASSQLSLLGDDGVTPSSATLGASGSLANHQCSVNTGSATAVWSGSTLTMTVAMTFLPAFAGPLQSWMDIYTPTADSGWSQEGSWTVTAPPNIVSVVSASPCCGAHGSAQTFVFKYADSSGSNNIQTAWAWFTPANNSGNAAHSCQFYYSFPLNQWNLLDDTGTVWMSATASNVTLRNSQCSFSTGNAISSSGPGDYFQLTIYSLNFTPAFSGLQQIWGYATAAGNNNSGWRQTGSFTVGSPIQISVQPNSGSGPQQFFQVTVSDSASGNLSSVSLLINSTSSAANACYLQISNTTVNLVSDNGLGYAGTGYIGSSSLVALQNSQCIINTAGSTMVTQGASPLTEIYTIGVSFKSSFIGAKTVYAGAADAIWTNSLQPLGTWTVAGVTPNVVQAVSVTPSSGFGTSANLPLFGCLWGGRLYDAPGSF